MNRGWKGLLGVVSATAVTLVLTTGPAGAAAAQGWWSTEGYTVTNSGFNPNEPTLTAAKVPGLKLWRTTSPDQKYQSAPVLDKGRVFVYSAEFVTAYDEATGEQLWRHEQPKGELSNHGGHLVVTEGKLVVAWNYGSDPYSSDYLEVLDATTGTVLVEPQWTDGSVSRLLVDKGVVVLSGDTRYYADTVAFDLNTGKQIWTNANYMFAPASANGRILVRGHGGNVGPEVSQVVDIRTGKVLVSVPNTYYSVLAASPDGSKFYLAWGHSLQALDATTGKLSWIASYVYPQYAALSPTGLYVSTTDHKMFALNLSDSKIAWTRAYTTDLLRPIVSGGVLYVTAYNSRLYALNPVDGSALTTPAFPVPVYPPVVTGARVYLTDGAKMSVYGL